MAVSIVKVPKCAADDMDFLAFSFNGKHSWDDFHIYRTSDGDRYNENLTPTLTDKTAEVPGGDGMYYFGTTHKQRDFNISFAFDSLTEVQLRELKKWLNGKEMGDLWFQEAPYKVWTVKPAGNSSIKYIPFDNENGQRVYKGEGTVQFVAYWPYAHTPDFVELQNGKQKDGRQLNSYGGEWGFFNKNQWAEASGLQDNFQDGENYGELPTPFVVEYVGEIAMGDTIQIGNLIIECQESASSLIWDSRSGMVSGIVTNDKNQTVRRAIKYSGTSMGTIPVGGIETDKILCEGTLKYHYWYY